MSTALLQTMVLRSLLRPCLVGFNIRTALIDNMLASYSRAEKAMMVTFTSVFCTAAPR